MITRRDLIAGLCLVASAPLLTRLEAPGPAALGLRGLFRSRGLASQRPWIVAGSHFASLEGGGVEVRTRSGVQLLLNETAREIIALCDGETSVREIEAELSGRYAVSSARLRVQVADTVIALRRADVLRT